ncbi:MAG: phage/plasmid primase, P4 family [Sulfurovum sp.]|nr:phage/plasmid primase, P4 family [Sulfurovum sp.]
MKTSEIIPYFTPAIFEENCYETQDIHLNTVEEILLKILSNIKSVELVQTLQHDYGDELLKYRMNECPDMVDPLKVPQDLYVVAIACEIGKVASRHGLMLAKKNGVSYLFNGIVWQRVEDEKLKTFFGIAAAKLGYYSPATAQTSGFTKKGLEQIVSTAPLMNKVSDDNTVKINLLNGTLEITENGHTLKEHNALDYMTYVLPFKYDPSAKAPLFHRYLDRVLPDPSSQMVLQEFLGYVFVKHLKLEVSMILLGGGQNGKSVMFEIINALLGKENVSTKTLGDLTGYDSMDNLSKIADKLLNYGSEIRGKDIDVDIFKRLVSGESVAAREKYKTGFDLVNNCKFVFNANKLPQVLERSDAYFRRFLIIPFTVKISNEEKDPELHTKIIQSELAGVLNWVIEGLDRLLAQKKFSECTAATEALQAYKRESDTVLLYLEEYTLVPDATSFRLIKDIYKEYESLCKDSGYRALVKSEFSKELTERGFENGRKNIGRGFYMKKQDTA